MKGSTTAFAFEIKENAANGKTYHQMIVLDQSNPKGSVTIQLPAGSYTVSELHGAGYELVSCNPANGTVLVGEGDAVVRFVNEANKEKIRATRNMQITSLAGTARTAGFGIAQIKVSNKPGKGEKQT